MAAQGGVINSSLIRYRLMTWSMETAVQGDDVFDAWMKNRARAAAAAAQVCTR